MSMDERSIDLIRRSEIEINPKGKSISGQKPIEKATHFLYEFNTAMDLINAINPINSELYASSTAYNLKNKFIFRGHLDSRWHLVPSFVRKLLADFPDRFNDHYHAFHSSLELKYLLQFLVGLSDQGFHLGSKASEMVQAYFKRPNNAYSNYPILNTDDYKPWYLDFPFNGLENELALAQHYRIPTRILDFSYSPLKALFFATRNLPFKSSYVDHKSNPDLKIGIWAIPIRLIELLGMDQSKIALLHAPSYQNKNINAQEGLFVNWIYGDGGNAKHEVEKRFLYLDEYLKFLTDSSKFKDIIEGKIGKPMLLTLPYSEADDVIKYLEFSNIKWTTIQPDLYGVAQFVVDRGYTW